MTSRAVLVHADVLFAKDWQVLVGIDGHQHFADVRIDKIAHEPSLKLRGDLGVARRRTHHEIVDACIVEQSAESSHLWIAVFQAKTNLCQKGK